MEGAVKIVTIGGGSSYTPELMEGFIKRYEELPIREIWLVDIEDGKEKLEIVGKMAQRMWDASPYDVKVHLTLDRREALKDADFVTTQFRVGLLNARIKDERIPFSYGLLGQETNGAGGIFKAFRTIPVILDIVKDMKELCPNAWLINFTNPSGIITQALRSKGFDNVYGICDAPSGFIKQLEEILEIPYGTLDIECYGLNHLSWFRNAKVNGRDVQRELLDNPRTYEHSEMRLFTREMARISGDCMLNEYLYFYYRRVKSLSMIQKADHPRGEMIYLINRELEEQLARLELPRDFEQAFSLYMTAYGKRENAYFSVESGACREKVWNPPTVEEFLTAPDEGGYAAVALRFIRAITDGENCRMVLSVPNNGAIDGLRDDDVVEITCDIRSDGAHPVRIGAIDEFQLQQIKRLKYFERCTIQAILEDDRDAAVKGLALHPLVNDFELAETLTDIFFDKYAEFIHMNETP